MSFLLAYSRAYGRQAPTYHTKRSPKGIIMMREIRTVEPLNTKGGADVTINLGALGSIFLDASMPALAALARAQWLAGQPVWSALIQPGQIGVKITLTNTIPVICV